MHSTIWNSPSDLERLRETAPRDALNTTAKATTKDVVVERSDLVVLGWESVADPPSAEGSRRRVQGSTRVKHFRAKHDDRCGRVSSQVDAALVVKAVPSIKVSM